MAPKKSQASLKLKSTQPQQSSEMLYRSRSRELWCLYGRSLGSNFQKNNAILSQFTIKARKVKKNIYIYKDCTFKCSIDKTYQRDISRFHTLQHQHDTWNKKPQSLITLLDMDRVHCHHIIVKRFSKKQQRGNS